MNRSFLVTGHEFPEEVPDLYWRITRTRHLAMAGVGAGILGAKAVFFLPESGVIINFPEGRHEPTLGERTMLSIASAISPPIAQDTSIDLPRTLHVAGLDGLLVGLDKSDPVLREIDAARTILGEASLVFLSNFVACLLGRLLEEGFFIMPEEQLDHGGNIAPIIRALLGDTPIMLEVAMLRREIEKRMRDGLH